MVTSEMGRIIFGSLLVRDGKCRIEGVVSEV